MTFRRAAAVLVSSAVWLVSPGLGAYEAFGQALRGAPLGAPPALVPPAPAQPLPAPPGIEALQQLPGSAFGVEPLSAETVSRSYERAETAERARPALHAAPAASAKAPLALRARFALKRPIPAAVTAAAAAEAPIFLLAAWAAHGGGFWRWAATIGTAAVIAIATANRPERDHMYELALVSTALAAGSSFGGWSTAAYPLVSVGIGLIVSSTLRSEWKPLSGEQLAAIRAHTPAPTPRQAEWLTRIAGTPADRLRAAEEIRRGGAEGDALDDSIRTWAAYEKDTDVAKELVSILARWNDRHWLGFLSRGKSAAWHAAGEELKRLREADEASATARARMRRAEGFTPEEWGELRARAEASAASIDASDLAGKSRQRSIQEAVGSVEAAFAAGDLDEAALAAERLKSLLPPARLGFMPGGLPPLAAAPVSPAKRPRILPAWQLAALWLGAAAVAGGRLWFHSLPFPYGFGLSTAVGLVSAGVLMALALEWRDGTFAPALLFLSALLSITTFTTSHDWPWIVVPLALGQAAALQPVMSQRLGLLRLRLKRKLAAALPDPSVFPNFALAQATKSDAEDFNRRLLGTGAVRLAALKELSRMGGTGTYIAALRLLADEDPWLPVEKQAVEALGALAVSDDEALAALRSVEGRHPAVSSLAGVLHLRAIDRRLQERQASEAASTAVRAFEKSKSLEAANAALGRAKAELEGAPPATFVEASRRQALAEASGALEKAAAGEDATALALALQRLEGLLSRLGSGFGAARSSALGVWLRRPEVLSVAASVAGELAIYFVLSRISWLAQAQSPYPFLFFLGSLIVMFSSKKGSRIGRWAAYSFILTLNVWLLLGSAKIGMWWPGFLCATFVNLRFVPIILRNRFDSLEWGKWSALKRFGERAGTVRARDWMTRMGGWESDRRAVVAEMLAAPEEARPLREAVHFLYHSEVSTRVMSDILDLFVRWDDRPWLRQVVSMGGSGAAKAARLLAELEQADARKAEALKLAEQAAVLASADSVETAAARGRVALEKLDGGSAVEKARAKAVREALNDIEAAGRQGDAGSAAVAARRLDELLSMLGAGFGAWSLNRGKNTAWSFSIRLAAAAAAVGAAWGLSRLGWGFGGLWVLASLAGTLFGVRWAIWGPGGTVARWWWGAFAASGFGLAIVFGPLGAYYSTPAASPTPLFVTLSLMNLVIGGAVSSGLIHKRGWSSLPPGLKFPPRPSKVLAGLVSSNRFVKWWLQSSWILGLGLWSFIHFGAALVFLGLFVSGMGWVVFQNRIQRWVKRGYPPEKLELELRLAFDALPPGERERTADEIAKAARALKPRPAYDHPFLLLASERPEVRLAAWRAALPAIRFVSEFRAAGLLAATLSIYGQRIEGAARSEEFGLLASIGRPGAFELMRLLEGGLYQEPRRGALNHLGRVLDRLTDGELEKLLSLPLVQGSDQFKAFESALAARRRTKVPPANWDQRARSVLERLRSSAAAAPDAADFSRRARLEVLRGLAASVEGALSEGDPGVLEITVLRLEQALDGL
jgi:hypothetical protein